MTTPIVIKLAPTSFDKLSAGDKLEVLATKVEETPFTTVVHAELQWLEHPEE